VKLRYTAASPFSRKVLVTAIECGLADRMEKVAADLEHPEGDLALDNPLGKVPTLVLDDGTRLIESPLICAWLEEQGGGKLIPAQRLARTAALQLQALGDGIGEAAIAVQRERNRPEDKRMPAVEARQKAKFDRTLDLLEREFDRRLAGRVAIGHVALACALGWVDFRMTGMDWRASRPKLARWYADFCRRPSMQATAPPAKALA
jgi:glutathione S-transferase